MQRRRLRWLIIIAAVVVQIGLTEQVLVAQWQKNVGGINVPGGVKPSIRYLQQGQRALPSANLMNTRASGMMPSEIRGNLMRRGDLPSGGRYSAIYAQPSRGATGYQRAMGGVHTLSPSMTNPLATQQRLANPLAGMGLGGGAASIRYGAGYAGAARSLSPTMACAPTADEIVSGTTMATGARR